MLRDQAIAIVRQSELASKADKIIPLLHPEITCHLVRAEQDSIPVGASRAGGWPDLPAEPPWDAFWDEAYVFICQIDLADLPGQTGQTGGLLPDCGWLWFFVKTDVNVPTGHVLYYDGEASALRRSTQPVLPTWWTRSELPPSRLVHRTRWTIRAVDLFPSFDDTERQALAPLLAELATKEDFRSRWPRWLRWCTGAYRQYRAQYPDRTLILLGEPPTVNGWPSEVTWAGKGSSAARPGSAGQRPDDSESEEPTSDETWSIESDYAEGRPWQVLLGVPISGGLPNWDWHDMGYLHFGIRRTDLAERRFDRAVFDVDMY